MTSWWLEDFEFELTKKWSFLAKNLRKNCQFFYNVRHIQPAALP